MRKPPLLIIFDLDGTLVDPAGAITGGITAALQAYGLPVPPAQRLDEMVGPPLVTSLRELAGVPEVLLESVIRHYRAGYRSSGMSASRPYPGVVALVEELRTAGNLVSVATQKPQWLAGELLKVQQMDGLFDSIHGAPRNEQQAAALDGKVSIIAAALDAHRGTYTRAVMIGDRSHDVHGAAQNGLRCIGVSWGFGTNAELTQAGAVRIVDSPDEVPGILAELGADQVSVVTGASTATQKSVRLGPV